LHDIERNELVSGTTLTLHMTGEHRMLVQFAERDFLPFVRSTFAAKLLRHTFAEAADLSNIRVPAATV
jgi:hypothetical protein